MGLSDYKGLTDYNSLTDYNGLADYKGCLLSLSTPAAPVLAWSVRQYHNKILICITISSELFRMRKIIILFSILCLQVIVSTYKGSSSFKLRGMCANMVRVVDYEFIINTLDSGLSWTGLNKTDILFDDSLKRWEITSKLDHKNITTMDVMVSFQQPKYQYSFYSPKSQVDQPTGVNSWVIPVDLCGEATEISLLLSPCSDTEFGCHDGSCVLIENR